MASDVSQRAREVAADIWRDYVAKVGEVIVERCMREGGLDDGLPSILARFEAESRAETALPPILIDPTGKGYPTDERPMTVAEFEAVIRADATAIERERCADAVLTGAGHNWQQIAAAIRKGPTP